MASTRLLKALIDTHLSAARILEVALREIECENLRLEDEARAAEMNRARKRMDKEISTDIMSVSSADSLMTVPEVMAFLKVSRTTLYDLLKNEEIRIIKIGRVSRIKRSDIIRFVDRFRTRRQA